MAAAVFEAITFYFILLLTIFSAASADDEDNDRDITLPRKRSQRSVEGNSDNSGIGLFPGTNWCGRGFNAEGYSHLGTYVGADKCCRQHDLGCPAYIKSGESKFGLYNWKMYTIMHCTCDERFRSCLKMVNSARADMVGRFFFDYIRIPCFVFSSTSRCVSWTWWGKCIREQFSREAVLREPISY